MLEQAIAAVRSHEWKMEPCRPMFAQLGWEPPYSSCGVLRRTALTHTPHTPFCVAAQTYGLLIQEACPMPPATVQSKASLLIQQNGSACDDLW